MSASRLLAAGYTDLVSVAPPGASFSPNSTIDPKMAGKVPAKLGGKGWYGYNFVASAPPTERLAKKWDAWGSNVGLKGDHFPALDIDSHSPRLTEYVLERAREELGPAPVRLSKDGPSRLLPYRTGEPFPRTALIATYAGQSHLIEFLGRGRQYLVHGTHPSGAEYRWEGAPLWDTPPGDLPEVTGEQAATFLDQLAADLREAGMGVERVGGNVSREPPPPQDTLRAPSVEALQEMVDRIPNPASLRREDYIQMGYAIKAAGQDDEEAAFEAWQSWADRWEGDGEDDPEADRRNWDRLHPPYRVGWPWIQERAEDLSDDWDPDRSAQEEFEADPDADPAEILGSTEAGGTQEDTTPLFILHRQALERPELLEPPPALIPRLAWRGRITLLAGGDKSGKSTLLAHATAALTTGRGFLGDPVPEGRAVLVGLEEALGDQVRRSQEEIAGGVNANHLMYATRPHPKILEGLKALHARWPFDLLVIDSLAEYARTVLGEAPSSGDSAKWGVVVRPLAEFARRTGAAVVILHHVRRSDGQYRDSGEIAAAMDVLLELSMPGPQEDPLTRRIRGRGRWLVEPFTVRLEDDGYSLAEGVRVLSVDQQVTHVIQHEPGISITGIRGRVDAPAKEIAEAITALTKAGLIEDRGKGTRGQRTEFYLLPSAGEEFSLAATHSPTATEESDGRGEREDQDGPGETDGLGAGQDPEPGGGGPEGEGEGPAAAPSAG